MAVTIAGGKAFDRREMVVEIEGDRGAAAECSLVFGVQGSPAGYLNVSHSSSAISSGPFLIMKGGCWGADNAVHDSAGLIALPSGWAVDVKHCSAAIHSRIEPDPVNTDSTYEDKKNDAADISATMACLSRPRYLLPTPADSSAEGPLTAVLGARNATDTGAKEAKVDTEEVPRAATSKHQDNAYIQIIHALMTNDRSFFTSTEVGIECSISFCIVWPANA